MMEYFLSLHAILTLYRFWTTPANNSVKNKQLLVGHRSMSIVFLSILDLESINQHANYVRMIEQQHINEKKMFYFFQSEDAERAIEKP